MDYGAMKWPVLLTYGGPTCKLISTGGGGGAEIVLSTQDRHNKSNYIK